MIKSVKNKIKAFSLVEIIIYLAIFTSISILVINSFITILSSFNATASNRKLLESGTVVMERISREIRQSKNIDIVNSSLGSNPGILQLNSTDNSGNPETVKFIIEDSKLNLYKGGVLVGSLTSENLTVTNLIFNRISTSNSEAVKINMTIRYNDSKIDKSENFYNTIVLRGGY